MHREKYLFLECNVRPGLKGISKVCPDITQDVLLSILTRAQNVQQR